jgi:hypothetical protein
MVRPLVENLQLIDGSYYVTRAVAAQLCSVTKSTLASWHQQPNAPPFDSETMLYNLVDLGEWIRREQIYKMGKGGSYPYRADMTRYADYKPPVITLPGMTLHKDEDQKERYERLRGDKLEMEIQEKAGQLVDADSVLIAMTAMASRVKTRLMSVPTALAPVITGMKDRAKVQSTIKDEIAIALEELSGDYRSEMDYDEE